MLLASYQPLVEDAGLREMSRAFDALEKELGFTPYFCFPAEKLEDMLVHSFFVTPSCPEKIIIFETENYQTLDIVRWNQILKLDMDGMDYDVKAVLNCAKAPFCEYLVPAFENVRFEIGIQEALRTQLTIDYENEDVRAIATGKLAMAQGKAIDLIEKARWENVSGYELDIRKMRMAKNAFEICVLPLLYVFMVTGRWEDIGISLNPKWIFGNVEPQRMLARIYNPDEAMEFKTYAYFQKAFSSFQLNMDMGYSRPSKNGPCPCGSGKKYKRCCGKNK